MISIVRFVLCASVVGVTGIGRSGLMSVVVVVVVVVSLGEQTCVGLEQIFVAWELV